MDKIDAVGSSALWLPKGSVLTRVGFDADTDSGYKIGQFAVETRAPKIYATFLSQYPDFEKVLLNIIFGKILGDTEGPLETASFREMIDRDLVSRVESNLRIMGMPGTPDIALYTDPSQRIGNVVNVSCYDLRRDGTLYETKVPVLVDYQKTLLS